MHYGERCKQINGEHQTFTLIFFYKSEVKETNQCTFIRASQPRKETEVIGIAKTVT